MQPLELGLVGCHALDGEVDGRDLVEQEIEAALRGAPDRFEAAGAHPERGMRLLSGARFDDDIVEMPALAMVREALAGGPRLAQERHRLVEALGRLLDWNREARELRRAVPLANAEVEPAVGQQIERGDLLCEQYRIVPRQHHHGGTEADFLCASSQIAEEVERSRKLPDAREVVLDYEHAVIAELFGAEHVVDVFAVAQAVSDRPFARGPGSAEQSELHDLIPMRKGLPRRASEPFGHTRRSIASTVQQIGQPHAISQASRQEESARATDEVVRLL